MKLGHVLTVLACAAATGCASLDAPLERRIGQLADTRHENEVRCYDTTPTGSRLSREVCRTPAEVALDDRRSAFLFEQSLVNSR